MLKTMKWDTEGAFSYSEQLRQHDYPIFYQKKIKLKNH